MDAIIDLTLPLHTSLRGVSTETARTLDHDGWNASVWHLYSHAGTHMDAPVHFGVSPATIDQTPLASCMGPAWIVDLRPCPDRHLIEVEDIAPIVDRFQTGDSLLLLTGWSAFVSDATHYRDRLPRIADSLAHWCVDRQVRMLGVEPPSVADVNDLPEVTRIHQILLGGGVTIVEGLAHLDHLESNYVYFFAIPLKLADSDGSPVRAFATNSFPGS